MTEVSLWDAQVVAQRTGETIHNCYRWLYKHQVTRDRLVSFSRAFGWDDIRDRIKDDVPLVTLGEAGLMLKQAIHQSRETRTRLVNDIPKVHRKVSLGHYQGRKMRRFKLDK